jgi:endonuclease III
MGFHNVARKLAALIMNDALGFVYFLVVDTHLKQVLPKIGWTDKTNADDIAIDIEDWLDRMLLKETNEMIVGIRQLYKYSTKSEKTIIIQFINMYSKTKHSDLLVGLL